MAFAATVRKPRGNTSRHALVPHQSPNSGAFRVGQKVTVIRNMGKLENATIRFIGETKFYSGVTWYGVELGEATGKNNGSVHGERYFRCAMNHGLFVRREMISHSGWGRQATSRSPFKGDSRTLMSDDVDDKGSERGMWAVDDGEAATLSSKATTSSRVRSLFDNKKEETRKRIQDRVSAGINQSSQGACWRGSSSRCSLTPRFSIRPHAVKATSCVLHDSSSGRGSQRPVQRS